MNIIITGASGGIGKAIAIAFAEQGHQLFLCARNEVRLYQTMQDLQTRYPQSVIRAKAADLSEKDQAISFGEWCVSQAIPDILVNNAGVFEPGTVANEEDGTLERQINTNLYSAYHLTRAVLPAMLDKPRSTQGRGHIFNMCSIASLQAYTNGGAYSISKYALHGFSANLRDELKQHAIKVTSVFPGAVMTRSWEGFDNSSARIMEANDIAKMVLAAASLSPQACVEEILIRPQLGDL